MAVGAPGGADGHQVRLARHRRAHARSRTDPTVPLRVRSRTVFGRTTNLYVGDRCFVPRRVCKVHVKSSGATLLLPRDGPSTVVLQPRQYDVVLGAAR